jgi:hypothetical protein
MMSLILFYYFSIFYNLYDVYPFADLDILLLLIQYKSYHQDDFQFYRSFVIISLFFYIISLIF